jgi:WXXGXW repeat (2 copies)
MMLFRKCISGVRTLAFAAAVAGLLPLWQSGTARAQVSVGISVNFAPPALPVYEQPPCPGEGYLWTPGYWAWDPDYGDYYWVPGTWVLAPQPGYLWTPPYWGWSGVAFIFHEGYWGPRIGFYGGIDYGYGYPGRGYYGGRWERDRFYYNRSVNNVNVTQIHNVYNKTVINNVNVTRVSYNGGEGGVRERANRQEEQAFRERHVAAVAAQQQHIQEARADRALRASDNRGKPPIAATDRPGQFRGNVVAAREGRYNPPANRAAGNRPENRAGANRPENGRPENNVNRTPEPNRPPTAARPDNRPEPRNDRPPNARGAENNNRPTYVHPNELPKTNRTDRPPSSGNAKADQRYQQRSDNMYKKQEQERQNLEKKQEQQHARAEQQRANDARRQQMEHQHQQQTQKLEQRQQQQQDKMQRQAPQAKPQPQPKQQQPRQQEPKQPGEKPHGR